MFKRKGSAERWAARSKLQSDDLRAYGGSPPLQALLLRQCNLVVTCGSKIGPLGGAWSKQKNHYVIWSRCTVRASGMCPPPIPFLVPFIRVLRSLLSRVYLSQRLSRPVLVMQGESSRRRQITRLDKKKGASVVARDRRLQPNLQDLDVCCYKVKAAAAAAAAAAAVVESWYKPDTLGRTTMPDT